MKWFILSMNRRQTQILRWTIDEPAIYLTLERALAPPFTDVWSNLNIHRKLRTRDKQLIIEHDYSKEEQLASFLKQVLYFLVWIRLFGNTRREYSKGNTEKYFTNFTIWSIITLCIIVATEILSKFVCYNIYIKKNNKPLREFIKKNYVDNRWGTEKRKWRLWIHLIHSQNCRIAAVCITLQ